MQKAGYEVVVITKLEMSERDAASRSSFKCKNCLKSYTDLEVIELIDNFITGDMKCNHCGSAVEEDESAGPQSDSRQALAKFNKQMEILFKILQAVENIKLDPSVLEPEPVEIGDEKGEKRVQTVAKGMPEGNILNEASYFTHIFIFCKDPMLIWMIRVEILFLRFLLISHFTLFIL